MATQEKLYTADDLWDLSSRPGNNLHYELSKGRLVEMSPTGDMHGVVAAELLRLMANHVVEHDLGDIYAAETGFVLSSGPDTVRAPDVSFVSKARLTRLTGKYNTVSPDLAVEVVSPSDAASEINDKVIEYFQAGTKLVWIVYPKSKSIHVYQTADAVHILKGDAVLDGGDVLPGFSVSVRSVFARLRE